MIHIEDSELNYWRHQVINIRQKLSILREGLDIRLIKRIDDELATLVEEFFDVVNNQKQ